MLLSNKKEPCICIHIHVWMNLSDSSHIKYLVIPLLKMHGTDKRLLGVGKGRGCSC